MKKKEILKNEVLKMSKKMIKELKREELLLRASVFIAAMVLLFVIPFLSIIHDDHLLNESCSKGGASPYTNILILNTSVSGRTYHFRILVDGTDADKILLKSFWFDSNQTFELNKVLFRGDSVDINLTSKTPNPILSPLHIFYTEVFGINCDREEVFNPHIVYEKQK